MHRTFDILRNVSQKLKGGETGNSIAVEDGRQCRAVMLSVPKSQPIDIEFSDIKFTVKQKKKVKTVLKGVSGKFKSGELTAIMGPSGAGKSSLLNILTGFQTSDTSGKICNRDCSARKTNQYKKESCYILQDDLLNPLFTVLEIMTMASDLKLGNNLSVLAKRMVIDDILEELGLSNTKETRCGNLSGGQKKRLSIALELIDNPPVMFLDEPTTGLDSSASYQCISVLKELARGGRTIVCTIHQPSATLYEMFDHIYVLAEGMCVYQGASTNTVHYLKTIGLECPKYHNPADYMLEVANCEYGNFNSLLAGTSSESSWRTDNRILQSNEPPLEKKIKDSKNNLFDSCKATVLITPPSEFTRFWVLFNRCLIQQYRDWTVTHLKLILHCFTGVMLGLLFENAGSDGSKAISNIGFFVVSLVYLTYTTLMPAVLRFPQEIIILKKENFNNWYKLRTYYSAVVLCNTPTNLLFSAIFCITSYFISSQPFETWRFFMYLGVCILVTLIAEAVGHFIGTLANAVNGTFCGAILTCSLLAFAGYLVQFPHMTIVMRVISHASYFRYSLEAMMQAVYGYDRPLLNCPENQFYCHLRYPSKILKELGMDESSYWRSIMILFSCLCVMRMMAFFSLRRNLRKS